MQRTQDDAADIIEALLNEIRNQAALVADQDRKLRAHRDRLASLADVPPVGDILGQEAETVWNGPVGAGRRWESMDIVQRAKWRRVAAAVLGRAAQLLYDGSAASEGK